MAHCIFFISEKFSLYIKLSLYSKALQKSMSSLLSSTLYILLGKLMIQLNLNLNIQENHAAHE